MAVQRSKASIAGARIYRLRQDCLADWLAAGGDQHGFSAAWPRIQDQLLPRGMRSPAIAAGLALGVVKKFKGTK